MSTSNDPKTSDFYEYCFSNLTKATQKDYQHVFTEYGCMEAVDIEYDELENKMIFSSKKQKPLIMEDNSKSNWILSPTHAVLPLGSPTAMSKLLFLPTLNELGSYNRMTMLEEKKRSFGYTLNVNKQICDLMLDHPDVAQGTFLELLSKYFAYDAGVGDCDIIPGADAYFDCGGRTSTKFLPKRVVACDLKKFPMMLDPFMFDVPLTLLNELMLEEMSSDVKSVNFDTKYTGGCLSYKHINSSSGLDYGVIVRPNGPKMDELSLQLLCTDTCKQFEDNEDFSPKLHLGSDYRFTLKGGILQTDIVKFPMGKCRYAIGSRSHNHVQIMSLNSDSINLNVTDEGQYKGLTYSSEECVTHLGVLQSPCYITSMSLSPYIFGECAITTDDGKLLIWNSKMQSNLKAVNKQGRTALQTINIDEMVKSDEDWYQVDFASHPRQLYVANHETVNIFDIRGKKTSMRVLHEPDDHDAPDEKIMTILSGMKFQQANEFQCLIATHSDLFLMDNRYCKTPLLNWSLQMRFPCQHLACAGFSRGTGVSRQATSMILAANQRPQELHMYQYSSSNKPVHSAFQTSTSQVKQRPPTSLTTPTALETFKDIRRAVMSVMLPDHGFLTRRLNYPIFGVAAYDFKHRNGNAGMIALQLSACGDLLYQPLEWKDPKVVYAEENITSGPIHRFADEERKRAKQAAEKVYHDWAEVVVKGYRASVDEEKLMNIRCTRTPLNAIKLSADKLISYITPRPQKPKDGSNASICVMCRDEPNLSQVVEIKETRKVIMKELNQIYDCNHLTTGGLKKKKPKRPMKKKESACRKCGSEVGYTSAILDNRRNGICHASRKRQNDFGSFEDEASSFMRPKVAKLNLVKPVIGKTGLGRVLISTWDGTYEDLWNSIKEECLDNQEWQKLQAKKAVHDLTTSDDDDDKKVEKNAKKNPISYSESSSFDSDSTSTVDSLLFEEKQAAREAKINPYEIPESLLLTETNTVITTRSKNTNKGHINVPSFLNNSNHSTFLTSEAIESSKKLDEDLAQSIKKERLSPDMFKSQTPSIASHNSFSTDLQAEDRVKISKILKHKNNEWSPRKTSIASSSIAHKAASKTSHFNMNKQPIPSKHANENRASNIPPDRLAHLSLSQSSVKSKKKVFLKKKSMGFL